VNGRKAERQQSHLINDSLLQPGYKFSYKIKQSKNSCKHHADKTNKHLDKLFRFYQRDIECFGLHLKSMYLNPFKISLNCTGLKQFSSGATKLVQAASVFLLNSFCFVFCFSHLAVTWLILLEYRNFLSVPTFYSYHCVTIQSCTRKQNRALHLQPKQE